MPQHSPDQSPAPPAEASPQTVLVAESDVIVRHAMAEYLRGCGFCAIEAASAAEAKLVLQSGPEVHILFADARLAGDEDGFALAQWARRFRPRLSVFLTSTLANKSESAAKLCGQRHSAPPAAAHLRDRIQSLRAAHTRRTAPRPPKSRSPTSRAKA